MAQVSAGRAEPPSAIPSLSPLTIWYNAVYVYVLKYSLYYSDLGSPVFVRPFENKTNNRPTATFLFFIFASDCMMHEALSTLNTVRFQLPPIRMEGLIKVTGSHIRYVSTDIADTRQSIVTRD